MQELVRLVVSGLRNCTKKKRKTHSEDSLKIPQPSYMYRARGKSCYAA